jgi:hypothetical protein
MDISDIMYETMKDKIKPIIIHACKEFETNPKYKIKKEYDGLELKGFCIYHDEPDYRVIDECHYIGKDKYAFLRMWKFASSEADKIRVVIPKVSDMLEFYKRVFKFKIIGENLTNFILERVKCQA